MKVRDYNGTGKWAWEAIASRYLEHAAKVGVQEPLHLKPVELVRGDDHWIYPLMDQVIAGIHGGDPACMIIGVEFLEEDQKFPFGANLKARAARALRQATIPPALASRLRRRIVAMLVSGNVPRDPPSCPMHANLSIDADPQQKAAASPLMLVGRSSSR